MAEDIVYPPTARELIESGEEMLVSSWHPRVQHRPVFPNIRWFNPSRAKCGMAVWWWRRDFRGQPVERPVLSFCKECERRGW